jgi:hemoglobin
MTSQPGQSAQAQPAPPTTQTRSLYERIGGEPALVAAMELFYQKILRDPLVAGFFAGMDMAAQRAKGAAFLSTVMDGPDIYRGRDMRAAHASVVARGMGDQHFDAIIGHLRATLAELGVPDAELAESIRLAEGARDEVLNR